MKIMVDMMVLFPSRMSSISMAYTQCSRAAEKGGCHRILVDSVSFIEDQSQSKSSVDHDTRTLH